MIEQIIKKYSDFYEGKAYTFIADKILEEESVALSHRTLRRMISEYVNSECCGDKPVCQNCPELPESMHWKHDEVRKTVYDNISNSFEIKYCNPSATYNCTPNVAKIWNKEDTLNYFDRIGVEPTVPLTWDEDKLQPYVGGNPKNVLIIPDTQFPFEREGALEFCRKIQEEYNCGTVVHIGDVKDSHASSFHTSDPDGYSAGLELDKTIERTREWHRVFPNVKVCLGNHDLIILRKAMAAGLSSRWIKGLAEVLETPTWEYDTEFVINGTMYTHTLGSNALNAALLRGVNLVVGHEHSKAEIKYAASLDKLIWSMNVGALVDDRKYAFAYGKTAPKKSVISCGVVKDGIPHLIPMSL